MTCPDCDREVFGAACLCGWKPQRLSHQPGRTVLRGKLLWQLCEWNQSCQIPVWPGNPEVMGRRHLCYFHDAHRDAPDQAHSFEAFSSWLAKLNTDYPKLGWWQHPAADLWPVVQGTQPLVPS